MSNWKRVGYSDVEKVTLVVKKDSDEDVFDWIQSIPYGKANFEIKNAIRFYLQHSGNRFLTERLPVSPAFVSQVKESSHVEEAPIPHNKMQGIVSVAISDIYAGRTTEPHTESAGHQDSSENHLDTEVDAMDSASIALLESMNDRF
jgi:hypothetical protein